MARQGTVANWKEEKGFGFIQPSTGGDQVFCHRSELGGQGRSASLIPGGTVSFDIGTSRSGKPCAINVTGPGVCLPGVGDPQPPPGGGGIRIDVMRTGVVTKWITDRGFGFIRPSDGGQDVFVHHNIAPEGQLEGGTQVRFLASMQNQKPAATFVMLYDHPPGMAPEVAAPLGGRCGGDDLREPPFDWAPGEGSRMRRWHPDCAAHCGGPVVADAPPVAPPQWPPGSQPPEDWGAGGGGACPLLAGLNRLRGGLEILRRAPSAVPHGGLPPPRPPLGGARESAGAPSPRPMLEWLLELPAQWAAARFPPDFGYFRTWVMSRDDFVMNSCSQFHRCDVICDDVSHPRRTRGYQRGSCCAVEGALRVLYRILSKVDTDVTGRTRDEAVQRFQASWDPREASAPDVPLAALRRLRPHDAVEGYLSTFLYTYNIPAPGGGERELQYFRTMNWAMRERGRAVGHRVQMLERVLSIFKPLIWRLDRFIASMPREGGVLFRGVAGVRMARWYRIGKHVESPSFLSLSSKGDVAWNFAGTGEGSGTWCAVQAAEALEVKWASLPAEDEDELLLGSNTVLTVMNKPTEDERQVLGTAHDAVSLAQVTDAAGGALRQLSPEETISYRVRGLAAHTAIFRDFKRQYVEPRVLLNLAGKGRTGTGDGSALQAGRRSPSRAAAVESAELRLAAAYEQFMRSDSQWLLVVAPGGEGKSSALLSLYENELQRLQKEWARQDGVGQSGKVPVFISLPLVGSTVLSGPQNWLPPHLHKQLHLGDQDAETGRSWALLEERGLIVFADSADEAITAAAEHVKLDTEALCKDLQKRSLAARAGLPKGSKGILSVRKEDMDRLYLTPAHIAGEDCAILNVLPFGDRERRSYCEQLAQRAAEEAEERLRALRSHSKDALTAALRGLPGCQPQAEAEMLHRAVLANERPSLSQLREQYAAAAAELTLQRAATLCPGEPLITLLFTMGAEAAQELRPHASSGAVIEVGLRRRMRRGAARVAPEAWPEDVRTEEDKVDTLMRVAEALAQELTYQQRWVLRAARLVPKADRLCEGSARHRLRQLLPGVPLRTSDAEDPDAYIAFHHRRLQEWLAAQFAVRIASRGGAKEAQAVVRRLTYWAGAADLARQAAADIAKLVEHDDDESAMWARVLSATKLKDWTERATALGALAEESARRYGEYRIVTAEALRRQGAALEKLERNNEATEVLERALAAATHSEEHDAGTALKVQKSLGALLCKTAPPGCSKRRADGEDMLRHVRREVERQRGSCWDVRHCDTELAKSFAARGALREAEELLRQCLITAERESGLCWPTAEIMTYLAQNLELQERWDDAVALRRRKYNFDRQCPQGREYVAEAARDLANALRHAGRPDEAEEVLRQEGLSDELHAQD